METLLRTLLFTITDNGETETFTEENVMSALKDMVALAEEGEQTGRIDLDNTDPEHPQVRIFFS